MVVPDSKQVTFMLSQENKRIRKTRGKALPDSRGSKAPPHPEVSKRSILSSKRDPLGGSSTLGEICQASIHRSPSDWNIDDVLEVSQSQTKGSVRNSVS